MKKILFLIPLIGICSSLLAQAPQVTNVQAEQVSGTKDVEVSFDLTGKPGAYSCFIEIWFKSESVETQWQQVTSISSVPPDGLDELTYDFYDEFGTFLEQRKAFTTSVSDFSQYKNFTWKAGEDVPDIQTADAQIRIIAFYPKMTEWATEKPPAEQVSGWDGIGDFGGSGGTPGNNGTGPSGDVYVRDYSDPNTYMVPHDPAYATVSERLQSQFGISPIAPTSYFDDASGLQLDVFELSDGIVSDLTGVMPPSGTLICVIDGSNYLIPVMLQ